MWLVLILLSLWPSVSADFDLNRSGIKLFAKVTGMEECFSEPEIQMNCILKAMRGYCSQYKLQDALCEKEVIERICGKQLAIEGGDFPGCVTHFHTANLEQVWIECPNEQKKNCFLTKSLIPCEGQFGCVVDTLKKICGTLGEECKATQKIAEILRKLRACYGNDNCILEHIYTSCEGDVQCGKQITPFYCQYLTKLTKEEDFYKCISSFTYEMEVYFKKHEKITTSITTSDPSEAPKPVTPGTNEPLTSTDPPGTQESAKTTFGINSTVPITKATKDTTVVTTTTEGDEGDGATGDHDIDETTPVPTQGRQKPSKSSPKVKKVTKATPSNGNGEDYDKSGMDNTSTTEDMPIIEDDYKDYSDLENVEEEEESSASFYSTLGCFSVFVVATFI